MFSFFKRKPPEKWRLVHTITVHVSLGTEKGKLYYHLHESEFGNRRVEFASTIAGVDAEKDGKRISDYQEKIYRWQMGRVDPEIPTYNQIPEEETANVLKGKIQ